jgi:hypothetical protein
MLKFAKKYPVADGGSRPIIDVRQATYFSPSSTARSTSSSEGYHSSTLMQACGPNHLQYVSTSTDPPPTSEKDSTCISPFVHPNVHVITCSSLMWPEMHASADEFTWFLYVRTPLVIASHNLFPCGEKDALTSLLIHAN